LHTVSTYSKTDLLESNQQVTSFLPTFIFESLEWYFPPGLLRDAWLVGRVYSKVYYSIRSLCGLVAKRSLKEVFSWDEFKERFSNDFGKVEEKRYSLEQLLEYASRKFDKSLEDLIVQNQISWQRRQEYAERNSRGNQAEAMVTGTPCGSIVENTH
jgi:hypothetical protein